MKYIIPVTVCICLLASCSGNNHPVDLTKSDHAKKNKPAATATVEETSLSGTVQLPGQLKPFEEVNIYAKVNGFVRQVYVDRGTIVHKGQVLARLEAPEMSAQIGTANSKLLQVQENAAASREKYRRLSEAAKEAGSVAPLELDNALSRMKADEAAVQSEKSSLSAVNNINDYLTITAPFDGVIVQRNVSAGALVGSGKGGDLPLFVLQQSQKLRLEVMIPEAYVDKVDLNHDVSFVFTAMPGKEEKARISRSSNTLSNMRSEAIEIDVRNPAGTLKPGMYGEVKIPLLSDVKSLLVPSSAIVRSTERMYVVLVKEGKAQLIDVKEGMKSGDLTEVLGNLQKGDQVQLNATDEVRNGDRIE